VRAGRVTRSFQLSPNFTGDLNSLKLLSANEVNVKFERSKDSLQFVDLSLFLPDTIDTGVHTFFICYYDNKANTFSGVQIPLQVIILP
jgi:hypothetical protein